MWKTQPHWVIADWLGLMEPVHGESCPSGNPQGPAGEDEFTSPGQESFHISTTPTTRGRKRRSPGSIPPRRVGKRQPHWVIADWLGLLEPARGESCLLGQRRGPAAPGEDKFPSPGQEIFYIYTTLTTWVQKRRFPWSIPPRWMWNPQPHWVIADWLGLMEPLRGESLPLGPTPSSRRPRGR